MLVFFTLLSLPAVSASADDEKPRRIALILEPARRGDAAKVGKLSALILEAFAKRKFERARLLAPLDPMGLEEGRKLAEQARKQLAGDHSLQRAAAHEVLLTRALLGLKAGLGAVSPKELADVYRGLATTRLVGGDRRLALEYMTAVLNLTPSITERDLFGRKQLKELFRELESTAHLRDVVTIRVESTPKGAEVFLGDELVGYTPITLNGLKEGTHLVRVRRDGFYSHGWLAAPRPAAPLTLAHRLRPVPGRSKFERFIKTLNDKRAWAKEPEKMAPAAEGLRRLLKADDIVVAKVRRTRNGYSLVGAVAPRGKAPFRLELDIPLDADLLKRVDVLTFEWAP